MLTHRATAAAAVAALGSIKIYYTNACHSVWLYPKIYELNLSLFLPTWHNAHKQHFRHFENTIFTTFIGTKTTTTTDIDCTFSEMMTSFNINTYHTHIFISKKESTINILILNGLQTHCDKRNTAFQ